MAHSNQAKKRDRQNETRRLHNKAISSRMRTEVKRLLNLCAEGNKADAEKALPQAIKLVDKALKANVIHRNTAARKKSLLARSVQRLSA